MAQDLKPHKVIIDKREHLRIDQARRIIKKFGGAKALRDSLALASPEHSLSLVQVYRWTYPRHKGGTGGFIPPRLIRPLLKASRIAGVLLEAHDLYTDVEFGDADKKPAPEPKKNKTYNDVKILSTHHGSKNGSDA